MAYRNGDVTAALLQIKKKGEAPTRSHALFLIYRHYYKPSMEVRVWVVSNLPLLSYVSNFTTPMPRPYHVF